MTQPVKPPRRGGRPRLPLGSQRTRKSLVSFTRDEWRAVQERALAAGFPVASYLRSAALGAPLAGRVDRRALAQLARAGNLLNQAVRYAHQTRRPDHVEEQIVSATRQIEEAIRELLP